MGKQRELKSQRIDALPLLTHYIKRCNLNSLLNESISNQPRIKVSTSKILLFILRNLMVSHFPLYKLPQWGQRYVRKYLGLNEDELTYLNDDRLGRALDKLFLADRSTLSTRIVLQVIKEFKLNLNSLHSDSTTLSFSGNFYHKPKFKKKPAYIIKGFNKDHRLNAKQLVFNLVVTCDGAVPIHYKLYDGNITDDTTHKETWDVLSSLTGGSEFIYVADSKLCTKENMKYIAGKQGKFITVLPRTRKEAQQFYDWIEEHQLKTKALWYRDPFPRPEKPKVHYRSFEDKSLRYKEGYRILWIHSSQKQKKDARKRKEAIQRAKEELQLLSCKLNTYHLRKKRVIRKRVKKILKEERVQDTITYDIQSFQERIKKQSTRGRPGPNTKYRFISKTRHRLFWKVDKKTLKKKKRADGFFPLITNLINIPIRKVLNAL